MACGGRYEPSPETQRDESVRTSPRSYVKDVISVSITHPWGTLLDVGGPDPRVPLDKLDLGHAPDGVDDGLGVFTGIAPEVLDGVGMAMTTQVGDVERRVVCTKGHPQTYINPTRP